MLSDAMDRATQDRLIEGFLVFCEQEGVLLAPEEDDQEGEYHCWVCDAVKPYADARCACDSRYVDDEAQRDCDLYEAMVAGAFGW